MKIFGYTEEEQDIHFGIKPNYKHRLSNLLKRQLQEMLDSGRDVDAVTKEINYLEGLINETKTKKEAQFNKGKLRGFWHKHYFLGTIKQIAINTSNHIQASDNFQKINEEALISSNSLNDYANNLAKNILKSTLKVKKENSSLTGDWIIYIPYDNLNYYLMLSEHSFRGENTDHLYDKLITECQEQFPFIFS